eukprot:511082_1
MIYFLISTKKRKKIPYTLQTQQKKKNKKKTRISKAKKFVLHSLSIVGKWLSLTDLVTDIILFYRATQYGSTDPSVLPLTVGLFTSMVAPYILSYSSGVKLFLFRGTFNELQGFYRILLLFYLFPTGILYFVFLDILDFVLNIIRWILSIICQWNDVQIKQVEEVMARQVGMDRMNWEGFKRQRAVAMLMFETIPQITIQALLYFDIISGKELTGVTDQILLTSIVSATLNSLRQVIKLVLESKAVEQNVIEYSLHCVMARVGWVPFHRNIDTFRLSMISEMHINYNIKYDIPIFTKCLGVAGSMEYDFSSMTIRHLITVLSQIKSEKKKLSIEFGGTLRLLTFQDLLLLLTVCQQQNIEISDIVKPKVFDFENAIEMSSKMDKDCRLFKHARNSVGRPLLMAFCDLGLKPNSIQSQMMYKVLQFGLDVNLTDVSTGESLIFSLLRNFDYSSIRYLLTRYCEEQKIKINLNYYNKNGICPLYAALELYNKDEKRLKPKKFMFEYLMNYGARLNDSIKENEIVSPLWYAVHEINDQKLIDNLLKRGCKLNIEEIHKLSNLYWHYAVRECKQLYNKNKSDDELEAKYNDIKEEKYEEEIYIYASELLQLRYKFMNNRINDADNDDGSILSTIYDIIQKCKLFQSFICDENKNNPLHLYVKEMNTNYDYKSPIIQFEQNNVIKLLKFECCDWIYQLNNDRKTPIDLCIESRNMDLLESFMFDTERDKYLFDCKNKIVTKNENKEEQHTDVYTDTDTDTTHLILNETLYKKLISKYNN